MKACLIGKTLGHSFSKEIHNMLGISYELREISPEMLGAFVKSKEYSFYNVTIPYKEEVMTFLDEIHSSAKAVGAVNTVVTRNGKSIGYNTDLYGMSRSFQNNGVSPQGKNVVILGSGGTSKTAQAYLKESGAKKVTIISRAGEWNYQNYSALTDTQILINTTPVGMFPNVDNQPVNLDYFPNLEFVFDVIYNPLKTKLLLQAEEKKIPCACGMEMLVYQAVGAEELWQETPLDGTLTSKVLTNLYRQKKNLVFIGMPACGKTTLGKEVAKRLDMPFIDFDAEIEREAKMTIPELFRSRGEGAFRQIESEIAQRYGNGNGYVLSVGGGTPITKENRNALKRNGIVFYVQRDLDKLITEGRPLSQKEGVENLFQKRDAYYRAGCDFVVQNNTAIDTAVEDIITTYEKNIGY